MFQDYLQTLLNDKFTKNFPTNKIAIFSSCGFITLDENRLARIEFVSSKNDTTYDSIRIRIIHKLNGIMDELQFFLYELVENFVIDTKFGLFRLNREEITNPEWNILRVEIMQYINLYK